MSPTLSTEEMRLWCRSHTRRGKSKYFGEHNREFATGAFVRSIGWKKQTFYDWLNCKIPLPKRVRAQMSKFIEQWDAGLLEFTSSSKARRAELVHRATPKVRTRMAVDFSGSVPRLQILSRGPLTRDMPSFPSVAGLTGREERSK